jgi:outer membrane protein OmpA-like peptidoglycan-associated protein
MVVRAEIRICTQVVTDVLGVRLCFFPTGQSGPRNRTGIEHKRLREARMKKSLQAVLVITSIFLGCIGCYAEEPLEVITPNVPSRVSYQPSGDDILIVSVVDGQDNPIRGLGLNDFVIRQGDKTAELISIASLETSEKVGLNVFLVLDNSTSMEHRKAVKPLLAALEEFLAIVRPVDKVQVVVFDPEGSYQAGGYTLHTKTFQSSDVSQLRTFFQDSYEKLSIKTYLYEGIVTAVDLAKKLPEKESKLIVVFSDGEDINSAFGSKVVESQIKNLRNSKVYSIDFMPGDKKDEFLTSLSETHGGQIWKATWADQLVTIFKTFATALRYQYVIEYTFLPRAMVAIEPAEIVIEEVTTIDSSPLLNYVYFDAGQSEIPGRYVAYQTQAETAAFDETKLTDTMNKYINVLNIIGKRLRETPGANVTIVGCNSGLGEEKGRTDLSRTRAEAVRSYLRYIWGIDPSRMEVTARDLPEIPSTSRVVEGIAENQRVEIYSDTPEILDTVKSAYVQEISDVDTIRVNPKLSVHYGVGSWKVDLKGDGLVIDSVNGTGDPKPSYAFSTKDIGLNRLARYNSLSAEMEITDKKGQVYRAKTTTPVPVKVLRREQLLSQRMGYKVMEKYALILFSYDRAEMGQKNEAILERIVNRVKELPDARAAIAGHTDTIGDEAYNMKLSERRAKAVYDAMMAGGIEAGEKITHAGVGPHDPLYDNALPEGRALNRTVTVYLEYEMKE